jgi:hypothetical protein
MDLNGNARRQGTTTPRMCSQGTHDRSYRRKNGPSHNERHRIYSQPNIGISIAQNQAYDPTFFKSADCALIHNPDVKNTFKFKNRLAPSSKRKKICVSIFINGRINAYASVNHRVLLSLL